MNGVEAVKRAVGHSHGWYEGTVADLTQQQADFLPRAPPTPSANSSRTSSSPRT